MASENLTAPIAPTGQNANPVDASVLAAAQKILESILNQVCLLYDLTSALENCDDQQRWDGIQSFNTQYQALQEQYQSARSNMSSTIPQSELSDD